MLLDRRRFVALSALSMGALRLPAQAPDKPNFSGTWKKDNARSVPVKSGAVTVKVEHRDPELTVEQTVVRPLFPDQHATQHYTTDGKESMTKGLDGDTYHTRVVWQESALVFTIVEHEDNNLINSLEVWSLSGDGKTLTRVRRGESGEQTLVYVRQG